LGVAYFFAFVAQQLSLYTKLLLHWPAKFICLTLRRYCLQQIFNTKAVKLIFALFVSIT